MRLSSRGMNNAKCTAYSVSGSPRVERVTAD
jgi:hypothetical protein